MPQKAKTVEWSTPQDLFDKLNEEFEFTLDPCATSENAKCPTFFTVKNGGGTRCSAILHMGAR